jgi:hypothetical protein
MQYYGSTRQASYYSQEVKKDFLNHDIIKCKKEVYQKNMTF